MGTDFLWELVASWGTWGKMKIAWKCHFCYLFKSLFLYAEAGMFLIYRYRKIVLNNLQYFQISWKWVFFNNVHKRYKPGLKLHVYWWPPILLTWTCENLQGIVLGYFPHVQTAGSSHFRHIDTTRNALCTIGNVVTWIQCTGRAGRLKVISVITFGIYPHFLKKF